MIYFDKLFTANQKQWLTLKIPYVAESTATNYILLSSKGDFVVDYEIKDLKTIPTVSAGGTFDPVAEAAKVEAKEKADFTDKAEKAEAQALRDGAVPRIEQVPPTEEVEKPAKRTPSESKSSLEDGDKMGNNLEEDPVVI